MVLRVLDWSFELARTAVPAFNLLEALFWFAVAAGFIVAALARKSPHSATLLLAAPVLALFGVSDLVEVHTGAWWRPWWLFLWKALCLMCLALLYVRYRAMRRPAQTKEPLSWTG